MLSNGWRYFAFQFRRVMSVCVRVSYLVIFYCEFIYCYLLESTVCAAQSNGVLEKFKWFFWWWWWAPTHTRTHPFAHAYIRKITHHVSFIVCVELFLFWFQGRTQENKENTLYSEVNAFFFFYVFSARHSKIHLCHAPYIPVDQFIIVIRSQSICHLFHRKALSLSFLSKM